MNKYEVSDNGSETKIIKAQGFEVNQHGDLIFHIDYQCMAGFSKGSWNSVVKK